MLKLEDIHTGSQIRGLAGNNEVARVVQVERVGDAALTVIFKDSQGALSEQMLFRSDEPRLELAVSGRPWAFDAPGREFKLGVEAYRVSQSALFDPMLAVHTSNVDPLPHQISAVYESMLPKQPLRFVLADDPGAGKTIMAGLLIRELLMRADARRVLIVAPGSLTEQWQDELREKFSVDFDIFSREKQEQCASGNLFEESDRLICRLDQLSRNEEFQELLKNTDWDLIVVDEAHKLSANYFGNKVNKTKRFQLGELLGSVTRHFLLMTATPHNGKEEDFQIWLSLLDGDRFFGKFREGAHQVEVSDLMRRMVKEDLLKFDGTRLFPERRAYTANYELSPQEASLYEQVTTYVREEMNRADQLDGKKKNNVGFALTMLQRRLASSPEAIYQSLKRRRRRLEDRLEETKLMARGLSVRQERVVETLASNELPENWEECDEELSAEEYEAFAEAVTDQATASATIPELQREIDCLSDLEDQAREVAQSEGDKKWEQLSSLLQDQPEMYTSEGTRRKLIIFTEHKDTLKYLESRISALLGSPDSVRTIFGGTNRDERRKIQEEFRNDPEVLVLIATDAAGEGVNLQNANLMVNYDLPWNPNRLEQRFGRIHRIGQREVCHLWNIVANETREGEVFRKLFDKIEVERAALGGKVFDVLGEAFENVSLRELLVEAIRYGESESTRARMHEVIDGALDPEHLKQILKRNALVEQHMGLEDLYAVKEEMEKAEARRLQPYFIRSFFLEAFQELGGELRPRESGRFEVRHVPHAIRERDRVIGESRTPVLRKYERICFEKQETHVYGKPLADLVHPKHPLMHAVTDLVLSQHRPKLKQGAVLLDPADEGITPRVIFMVDHSVKETGNRSRVVSRRVKFVEMTEAGEVSNAGWAPHLDLEPLDAAELSCVKDVLEADWLRGNLEPLAIGFASQELVPEHYNEVRKRLESQADRTLEAVTERLVREINYWSDRHMKLQSDLEAGKKPRMAPEMARRRVEEMTARLEQRRSELEGMKSVVSAPPVIVGGALVIPQGLLDLRQGNVSVSTPDAEARSRVERVAMQAVMEAEQRLGHSVLDLSAEKCGWDVTARPLPNADGSILPDRHIEVKGRAQGQETITVTRNEILYALNQADQFLLAIVLVDGEAFEGPFYVRRPFSREPDFGMACSSYRIKDLLTRAVKAEDSL